jgi:hypothetical protein
LINKTVIISRVKAEKTLPKIQRVVIIHILSVLILTNLTIFVKIGIF